MAECRTGTIGPPGRGMPAPAAGPGPEPVDGAPHPALAALEADRRALPAADVRLARAAAAGAPFAIDLRPPGFGTLLRIILEQQVSTAAARGMWAKLQARLGEAPAPAAFLALDDAALRACGFSRQKAGYGRALAEAVAAGAVDLDAVAALDDEAAVAALTALKGIGRWSAENYLLWALGRRDVFPAQDLALLVGWQWLTGADARPTAEALRAQAEVWRPRRTAATLLIWQYYLAQAADRRAAAPVRGSSGAAAASRPDRGRRRPPDPKP